MKSSMPSPTLFFSRKEPGPLLSAEFMSSAFEGNIPLSPIDTPIAPLGATNMPPEPVDHTIKPIETDSKICPSTPKALCKSELPLRKEVSCITSDHGKVNSGHRELHDTKVNSPDKATTGTAVAVDAEAQSRDDPDGFHDGVKNNLKHVTSSTTCKELYADRDSKFQWHTDVGEVSIEPKETGLEKVDDEVHEYNKHTKVSEDIKGICKKQSCGQDKVSNSNNSDTGNYMDLKEEELSSTTAPNRRRTFRDRLLRVSMIRGTSSISRRHSLFNHERYTPRTSRNSQNAGSNHEQVPRKRSTLANFWTLGGHRSDSNTRNRNNGYGADTNDADEYRGVSYEYRDHDESQQSITLDISAPFDFFRTTEKVDRNKPMGGNGNGTNAIEEVGSHRVSVLQNLTHRVTQGRGNNSNNTDSNGNFGSSSNSSSRKANKSTVLSTNAKNNAVRGKSEQSWLQGVFESVRNRGGGIDSTWKAGVYDFQVDGQTALQELKWLLEREYFGVVLHERFTQIKMRVPVTVAGKLSIIMIIITVEYKVDGGSRISVRRSFGDSFTVRHEDFDWFCFDVYRRLIKLRDVVRPYYH